VVAAEEFANYPGNVASPEAKGKNRDTVYGLDQNPYGGYEADQDRYKEYGGERQNEYGSASGGDQVVWQGPTEEALHAHSQREQQKSDPRYQSEQGHDYEYEQQKHMDAEAAAWRGQESVAPIAEYPNGHGHDESIYPPATASSWEPLSVNRETTVTDTNGSSTPIPSAQIAHDSLGAPLDLAPPVVDERNIAPSPSELSELAPPNAAFMTNSRGATPAEGFYTPMEELDADPINQLERLEQMEKDYEVPAPAVQNDTAIVAPPPPPPPPPMPIPVPSGRDSPTPMTPNSPTSASMFGGSSRTGGGGKISAAAFRRGAKPRMSTDDEASSSARRLPVPPMESPLVGVPPTIVQTLPNGETERVHDGAATEEGHGAWGEARRESDPPPVYGGESLR